MATLRFHAAFSCSVPHHSKQNASPPITERHASSRLASSLLRQPMQTPHGAALMALTNQGLPPCLISLAASHRLELLATTSSSAAYIEAHEDVLHRLIVEVKEREKREAVQEILFALVASKLLHAIQQDATQTMQTPRLDDLLQAIHSPDVQPLTSRHVAMVINGANHADDPVEQSGIARVRKIELGRMYAASVMYGYFLTRVHQRFKLDQRLQIEAVTMEAYSHGFNAAKSEEAVSMQAYIQGHGFQDEGTMHRMSSLSCPLTLNVIERHCEAMFGSVPCHMHRKMCQVETSEEMDTTINIQLGFVRTLIYQALAFGALLWEMEHNFVPLFYPHICQEEYRTI